MNVKFTAIAALGKNREIGLNGKVPWELPEEYAHYKKLVKGQYVVVGRKNFELNPSDVADSMPIVLSRNPDFKNEDALVFSSMEEIIEYADEMEIEKMYIIGGAEVFNLSLPYLSEFYCSVVDYEGPADKFFPQYLSYEWEVVQSEVHKEWTLYRMKKRPDF